MVMDNRVDGHRPRPQHEVDPLLLRLQVCPVLELPPDGPDLPLHLPPVAAADAALTAAAPANAVTIRVVANNVPDAAARGILVFLGGLVLFAAGKEC